MKYFKRLLFVPLIWLIFVPVVFETVMFKSRITEKYLQSFFDWFQKFGEY